MTSEPTRVDLSGRTRGDCFSTACPSRRVLAHVTGRWGALILAALREHETLRFSQLRDRVEGISEKMLAQTLRDLERDGLISRHSFAVVPPRVDYSLTPMGCGVAKHVASLVDWIESHMRELLGAQREHDAAS